ncbi:MAG: toxin [Proteobacteria bacterium]|nr:toxin [Pseudomonadota bacterium]MCL2309515.1 toxin [Pseudomonadota bacterium]
MSKISFNENIGSLEVPEIQLKKGLDYAQKNNIHSLRIMPSRPKVGILDISVLEGDESIEALDIHEDVAIKGLDLSCLYSMKKLKKLSIEYYGQLDFSKLKTLNTLFLGRIHCEIDSISIPSLRDLLLVSTKNMDCMHISSLQNLETLRISGGKIECMVGIENLSRLKSVRITHCPSLLDISAIGQVASLSNLYIETCKKLSDFSILKNNKSIETLFISDLDSVNFVPSMKKIKSLKFWNLKDGDLSPLLNSKTLSDVYFYPQKRHYTHGKDDINALLKPA